MDIADLDKVRIKTLIRHSLIDALESQSLANCCGTRGTKTLEDVLLLEYSQGQDGICNYAL